MFKKKVAIPTDFNGEPVRVEEWERKKILGSGGFGTVSLWTNKTTYESLAIKKCRWKLENKLTEKQKERWNLEVEMMKKIEHENIVTYKVMPDILKKALLKNNPSGVPILSMEYCELGCLRTLLSQPANCCGVSEAEVVNILKDTSNALKYLHNLNITHRDFKPENVVLQSDSNRKTGTIYKLIDLGYAKELGDDTVSFVGTLSYLAPEIFEKQTYDKSVDYWSFGITAFEIVCGVRPFLPNYSPVESFKEVKKKPSEVICVQYTHTGDMKSSKELLRENNITMPLKQNMEKWFRTVLQYEPERRGLIDNVNSDVFERLQDILSKKVITVFSIYNYEFYSYEVDESTLYSTLQDWIARDVKINKTDQFLVPAKIVKSNYVLDYCGEENSNPVLFVLKKNASISEKVHPNLPRLIKTFFDNIHTEYKSGTYKFFHAQVIHFIFQEIRLLHALINGICCLYDYLKVVDAEENKLFADNINFLKELLSEIEFYNKLETSLNMKMYKHAKDNNNTKLNEYLLEYKGYMQQVEQIIIVVGAITKRHKKIGARKYVLYSTSDLVLKKLRNYNFNESLEEALKYYQEILNTNYIKDLTGSMAILDIISTTLKIRDEIVRNKKTLDLLKACANYWKELDKLISGMKRIHDLMVKVKENVRQNVIKRLGILQDKSFKVVNISPNGEKLIHQNVSLRYQMQEFMNISILKYKNTLTNEESNCLNSSVVQNGID